MHRRLIKLQAMRKELDKELGLSPVSGGEGSVKELSPVDKQKAQKIALQKEKEEFLKSLGILQSNKAKPVEPKQPAA